jgi:hypothetical protein
MLALLAAAEQFIVGDVFYYHRKINALFTAGLDRTLYEYPTPVVWILWLPYGASFANRVGYLIGFVIFMLVLDAMFAYVLWRATGRRHDTSIDFWLIFVPLIGPLAYLRFDMLPAVLAGGLLAGFALHLDFQPLRERVDDGDADAVQAAGDLVAAAVAELAAGVQDGEDDLRRRAVLLLVERDGDAATVVLDADRAALNDIAGIRLVAGVEQIIAGREIALLRADRQHAQSRRSQQP